MIASANITLSSPRQNICQWCDHRRTRLIRSSWRCL